MKADSGARKKRGGDSPEPSGRKRTEEALQEAFESLRNDTSAMTGLTIDEAIGDGWQRAIHPDDRAEVCERWRQLREADELFLEEYRVCRPDGVVRWMLAEGVGLHAYSWRAETPRPRRRAQHDLKRS